MILFRYLSLLYLVCVKAENGTKKSYRREVEQQHPPATKRTRGHDWHDYEDRDVPRNFDSRTQWPDCESIGKIYDQGASCRWSWAVVTAATVTDRLCVFSKGEDKFEFSAVDLLSCCDRCIDRSITGRDRCTNTSTIYHALNQMGIEGVVSAKCKPIVPEIIINGTSPLCAHKCADGSKIRDSRKYIKTVRDLDATKVEDIEHRVKQIQIEMMTNGPVMFRMEAPKHFVNFFAEKHDADEIYTEAKYDDEREHSITHGVKVLGWGEKPPIRYWVCANSWGPRWGNGGFFKIMRARNLLQIENFLSVPYFNEPPKKPYKLSKISASSAEMAIVAKSSILCTVTIFLFKYSHSTF